MKRTIRLLKEVRPLQVKPHVPKIKFRYAGQKPKSPTSKQARPNAGQQPPVKQSSLSSKPKGAIHPDNELPQIYKRLSLTDDEITAINSGGASEWDKLEKKPAGKPGAKPAKKPGEKPGQKNAKADKKGTGKKP